MNRKNKFCLQLINKKKYIYIYLSHSYVLCKVIFRCDKNRLWLADNFMRRELFRRYIVDKSEMEMHSVRQQWDEERL